jgi:hypothetical protein
MAGLGLLVTGTVVVATAERRTSSDDRPAVMSKEILSASSRTSEQSNSSLATQFEQRAAESDHPLDPALVWACETMNRFDDVSGYSCVLVKREEVDGKLTGPQHMLVKVRHHPFSIYARYLTPDSLAGREAIFVEGQNNDKMIAHVTGVKHRLVGSLKLDPTGNLAMKGNRYPITEVGVLRLLERLVEVGTAEREQGCDVAYRSETEVDGRRCSCLELTQPESRPGTRYHIARVHIDEELQLPIRFEAYRWPDAADTQPPLVEEYTYTSIRFDERFDDLDFSPENPSYGFTRAGARKVAQN